MIEGFNLGILEDHHQLDVVDILRKVSEHPLTAEYLLIHLIMQRDGAEIKQAEAIRVGQLCNAYSALVFPNFIFV